MSSLSRRKKIFFSLFLTLLLLCGMEIALRLQHFRYQRSLSFMEFNYPTRHVIENIFLPDPVLLWRLRPSTVLGEGLPPLNAQGYRGADFVKEKKPGVLRVACLGDSVTFGGEVAYPDLLAEKLTEKLGRPVEAYNFGVPSYSSYQGLKLLPSVLADYHPDVVVILFGWNDHWLAKGFADKDQIATESKARPAIDFIRRFRVYQLGLKLAGSVRGIFSSPPPMITRVSPDDYWANLTAMISLCRKAGAVPVLAASPMAGLPEKLPDYLVALGFVEPNRPRERISARHAQYNAVVTSLAWEEKVIMAELPAMFKTRGEAGLYDDPGKDFIHPNAAGYRLVADGLTSAIVSALSLIPD